PGACPRRRDLGAAIAEGIFEALFGRDDPPAAPASAPVSREPLTPQGGAVLARRPRPPGTEGFALSLEGAYGSFDWSEVEFGVGPLSAPGADLALGRLGLAGLEAAVDVRLQAFLLRLGGGTLGALDGLGAGRPSA